MENLKYLAFLSLIFSQLSFAFEGGLGPSFDPSEFFRNRQAYSKLVSDDVIGNISNNIDEAQLKKGTKAFTAKNQHKANCVFQIAGEILKVTKLDKIFVLPAHVQYHDAIGSALGKMSWRLKCKNAAVAADRFSLVAQISYSDKYEECALLGTKSIYSFYLYDSNGGTFSDGASVFTATLTNKISSNHYLDTFWGVLKYSINDPVEYTELYHTVGMTP